ncbi:MAG TPA: hypothetical protein VH969_24175 [Actinophytocola sp.]|jgi:hypothetical protein|uniref:hypothetical protein n=1 Tax=Actinophytocola sp. TaxID=1872138 RepID=UPI002F9261B3
MTADVHAYLRRYWRRYTIGVFLPVLSAVGVSVWLCLRNGWPGYDMALLLSFEALLVGYAYVAVGHNAGRPHAWSRSAARFGAVAFLFACIASNNNVGSYQPAALGLFGVGTAVVIGWALAWHAKVMAEDQVGPEEVMAAGLDASFDARNHPARIEVDADKVQIVIKDRWDRPDRHVQTSSLSCALREVTSVKAEYLRRGRTHRLQECPLVQIELTPGPVLRLGTPRGEWIFPTDRAYTVRDIIEQRLKNGAGRPNLNTFLPRDMR